MNDKHDNSQKKTAKSFNEKTLSGIEVSVPLSKIESQITRRQWLYSAATGIGGVIAGSALLNFLFKPFAAWADNNAMDEFAKYKQQQLSDFNEYKAKLEQEYLAYVQEMTKEYEQKHLGILAKEEPSKKDIKKAGGDKERAQAELEVKKENIADDFQYNEKPKILAKAKQKVKVKKTEDKKILDAIEKKVIKADAQTAPAPVKIGPGLPVEDIYYFKPKPFLYPVKKQYRVSSYFGIRNLFYKGKYLKRHCGVDFAVPTGVPIYAICYGVVKYKFYNKIGGNSIIVEADKPVKGKKIRFSCCHMQRFAKGIKEGSKVRAGQTIIGYVGSTGRSTGAHIHFMNYEHNGKRWLKVNPLKYTQKIPMPKDKTNGRYQYDCCNKIPRKI